MRCSCCFNPDDLRWLHRPCAMSSCTGNAAMSYLAAAHNSHSYFTQHTPILSTQCCLPPQALPQHTVPLS